MKIISIAFLTFATVVAEDRKTQTNLSGDVGAIALESPRQTGRGLRGSIIVTNSALAQEAIDEDVEFWTRELGSKSSDRRLTKETIDEDVEFWTRELGSKSSDRR